MHQNRHLQGCSASLGVNGTVPPIETTAAFKELPPSFQCLHLEMMNLTGTRGSDFPGCVST